MAYEDRPTLLPFYDDDEGSVSQQRVYAWLIDFLIVLGLVILFKRWLGGFVATAYWLLRDGLFEGQSIGKRLMGVQVVMAQGGAPCTLSVSFLRNLLWIIPLVNILVGLNGLMHLARKPPGRPWGDRLAETRVVRYVRRRLDRDDHDVSGSEGT